MISDTGTSHTPITWEMAKILNLKATGMIEAQIEDGSKVKFITSKAASMAVGKQSP